jgi:hypothetical protein
MTPGERTPANQTRFFGQMRLLMTHGNGYCIPFMATTANTAATFSGHKCPVTKQMRCPVNAYNIWLNSNLPMSKDTIKSKDLSVCYHFKAFEIPQEFVLGYRGHRLRERSYP